MQRRRVVVSLAVLGSLAVAASAQNPPRGHIAATDRPGQPGFLDIVTSWNWVYHGTGGPWTLLQRNATVPQGLGVTALADDRRVVFWVENGAIKLRMESAALRGDWGPVFTWQSPASPISRIAVLGPTGAPGRAAGQIPVLFALTEDILWATQYLGGFWGPWERVASLALPNDENSSGHDIAAAWDTNATCTAATNRILVTVAASGRHFHRLRFTAGLVNPFRLDIAADIPFLGGNNLGRVSALPANPGCFATVGDVPDNPIGDMLFVTDDGRLLSAQTTFRSTALRHRIPTRAAVRAIHAKGTARSFQLRMVDTAGRQWASGLIDRNTVANPVWFEMR